MLFRTFCLLGLAIFRSIYSQEYDDYGEEAYDCNFYDLKFHECHHEALPPHFLALKNKFSSKVPLCCGESEYSFYDSCESREKTYGRNACGRVGSHPSLPKHEVTCPHNCLHVKDIKNFQVLPNGSLIISNMNEGLLVTDFCVAVTCLDDSLGWETIAQGCICLKDSSIIKKENEEIDLKLNRCCPPDTFTVEKGNELFCLSQEEGSKEHRRRECDDHFLVTSTRFVNTSDSGLSFKRRGEEVTLNVTSRSYCVGTTIKPNRIANLSSPSSFIRNELFYCQALPCDGASPCISTCCNPGEFLSKENHTCMSPNKEQEVSFLNMNKSDFDLSQIFHFKSSSNDFHFEKRALRQCEEGFESVILSKCFQSFYLEESIENGTYLTLDMDGTRHFTNEYCVYITEDRKFMGNVCREVIGKMKFIYYPIVLIISALLLFSTILIYSVYGKQLLNHYTRLMRHFTIGLFVAFTVLSLNQLFAFVTISMVACKIIGFIQQFSFLVSFTFMTLMSSEIFLKMKSMTSTNSQKRFNVQRAIGYGVPTLITSVTIAVEFSAPECSPFRPRFGEQQCFFTSKESIFIYFNIPILIMLLINTVMFFGTVFTILRVQRAAKSYFKNQRESLDRFALFVKLFLGMGIIWVFEIIAKGTSGLVPQEVWYFTDMLNMLQGFYVFIIFVCKRNVIEVILKRDGRRLGGLPQSSNTRGSFWLRLKDRQKSTMVTSQTNLDTTDSVKS